MFFGLARSLCTDSSERRLACVPLVSRWFSTGAKPIHGAGDPWSLDSGGPALEVLAVPAAGEQQPGILAGLR